MGWNYALQWLVVLPFELVAVGLTLAYWNSGLSIAVWITIFWVLIILINMAGVRGYGDCEMIFAIIKIAAVITFAIAGIVIDVGGVPGSEKIGLKYWTDPGIFICCIL
jgi:yeast amino acid transporter